MKNPETEKLKHAYGEVPEGFHQAVERSLESLEDKKIIRYPKRKNVIRLAAACVAVAAIGTFTVAAAATNFFGLFSDPVGTYGVHVGVKRNSEQPAKITHPMITASYVAKGFELDGSNPEFLYYRMTEKHPGVERNYYFISATAEEYYEGTYNCVIDSRETTVNGHQVIYLTHKYFENSDELLYGADIYFKEEGFIVHANQADLSELEKIVEGIDLVEDTEYNDRIAALNDQDSMDHYGTSFDEKLVAVEGKSLTKEIAQTIRQESGTSIESSANLTVTLKDIEEKTGLDGLSPQYFYHETKSNGKARSITDQFFDADGNLITDYTRNKDTYAAEDDYENLGTQERTKAKRHFYLVTLEISSDGMIPDPGMAVNPFSAVKSLPEYSDEIFYQSDGHYWSHAVSTGEAIEIYVEGLDENTSLDKGEKKIVKVGLIVDDDVKDMTYLEIGIIEKSEISVENSFVNGDVTTYCMKLF